MNENDLVLQKNKDLIEVTTNKITKQQLKAFNFVMYEARKELKQFIKDNFISKSELKEVLEGIQYKKQQELHGGYDDADFLHA